MCACEFSCSCPCSRARFFFWSFVSSTCTGARLRLARYRVSVGVVLGADTSVVMAVPPPRPLPSSFLLFREDTKTERGSTRLQLAFAFSGVCVGGGVLQLGRRCAREGPSKSGILERRQDTQSESRPASVWCKTSGLELALFLVSGRGVSTLMGWTTFGDRSGRL